MSEIMTPIPFERLLQWMIDEYNTKGSVFGVSKDHFYRPEKPANVKILGETLASPHRCGSRAEHPAGAKYCGRFSRWFSVYGA